MQGLLNAATGQQLAGLAVQVVQRFPGHRARQRDVEEPLVQGHAGMIK